MAEQYPLSDDGFSVRQLSFWKVVIFPSPAVAVVCFAGQFSEGRAGPTSTAGPGKQS